MRHLRALWVGFPLVLGLVVFPGCGGSDDPAAPPPGGGGEISGPDDVFAVLEVSRLLTGGSGKSVTRSDNIYTRFDETVGDEPSVPLQAENVTFGPWTLGWDEEAGYLFRDDGTPEFLGLGNTYDFVVTDNVAVPSFLVPVQVMDIEPCLTSPTVMQDVSLHGFTLEWDGSSANSTVNIVLKGGGDSGLDILVPNTGAYTFTGTELAGINTGDGSIDLLWSEESPLDVEGLKPGSRLLLKTRHATQVVFIREAVHEEETFIRTPDLLIHDALIGKPGAPVKSTIAVPAEGRLDDLRIYLKISHPYAADLTLFLTSPEGTSVKIFWRCESGEPNVDPVGWYPTDFLPKENLSLFNGENIHGSWVLTAQDVDAGAEGVLEEWRLEIQYLP